MKLKLLSIILLVLIFQTLFSSVSHAQFANPNYLNTNPDVPQNLNTYVQAVFINVATTASCILSGVDPLYPDKPCLGLDPETNKLGYVENGAGAIGIVGGLLSFSFQIPVSTSDYGNYMAGNFGIAKQTYAQGLGFNGLEPTLKLWEAFRNIAYMIFVALFIIIGLGIMFRIKIDPRTVMTIQNQIPKIIIALILVTFSYAIAGFLIDLMYVSMYVVISVFSEQGIDPVSISASSPFGAVGGVGGLSGIAWGVSKSISGIVKSIFDGTLGTLIGAIVGAMIGKFIGGGIAGIPGVGMIVGPLVQFASIGGGALLGGLFGGKIVGVFAGLIAYLVIVIALFSALLRLWFVLIKSYIYILINVVFAPLIIAKGLIPGQSGIGSWIRSMVANLSVFPVTIIMFMLGKTFVEGFQSGTPGNAPFVPPMVGNFADPESFAAIIGLAIVLMTPEVANMTRDALKVPDLKYSSAIGKSLGVGAGALGSPISKIGKKVWGVDPFTKEPYALTRTVQDRIGRGNSALAKGFRFVAGTQKHYETEDPMGKAQKFKQDERNRRLKENPELKRRAGRRGLTKLLGSFIPRKGSTLGGEQQPPWKQHGEDEHYPIDPSAAPPTTEDGARSVTSDPKTSPEEQSSEPGQDEDSTSQSPNVPHGQSSGISEESETDTQETSENAVKELADEIIKLEAQIAELDNKTGAERVNNREEARRLRELIDKKRPS